MGIRFRNATPGTLICLAATALLALASFNTPLLKSLNFLSATYSSGTYEGSISLGTLGFCHTLSGASNCTGPQVGYEFNPNDVFGVTLFDIPEVITKYLTYVLILHVVAFGLAAISTLLGLLAHSPTFTMCPAIWFASIASTVSLLATVFDLAMFYIARARINDVSGASATIGICVWLTLAAFVLLALSGCFFGIGGCCGACRARDESGDSKTRTRYDRNNGDEDYKMRMMAIENERNRKQEQGLPNFQELTPLKDNGDDKYLYEPQQQQQQQQIMPGGLKRDGSVLQGVGVGYGRRRTPANDYAQAQQTNGGYPAAGGWDQHQPQGYGGQYQDLAPPPMAARRLSDATSAGEFAGVGAGGAGVERNLPQNQGYAAGYYPNEHQYNETSQGYHNQDPYNQYNDPYNQAIQGQGQTSYNDPYRSRSTQPFDGNQYASTPMPMPTPAPVTQGQGYEGYSGAASSESHDPGPQVGYADPYDGYDDGLGAIGMAATSNSGVGRHERDYTGQTFGYNDDQINVGGGYGGGNGNGIAAPRPQHLVGGSNSAAELLRSPQSPQSEIGYHQQRNIVGGGGGGGGYDDELLRGDGDGSGSIRPPSYSAGNYSTQPHSGPEKSSYR